MDRIIFYIGQGLGVVAIILGFINYQVKTRKNLLYIHSATSLTFALHYLCLGAWAGMAMNFIGLIRNVVFFYLEKKGPVKKWVVVMFAVILGGVGIAASLVKQEGWYFIISVAALMINSYSMSFTNPNNVRKSILISSPMVFIYDCFVLSVGGAIFESIAFLSAIIGLIRFRKK